MVQLVTRVDNDLTEIIDDLIERGLVESRSDAVRQGLRLLVKQLERQRIANEIVAGYRRIPQSADDSLWHDDATVAMIEAEPW